MRQSSLLTGLDPRFGLQICRARQLSQLAAPGSSGVRIAWRRRPQPIEVGWLARRPAHSGSRRHLSQLPATASPSPPGPSSSSPSPRNSSPAASRQPSSRLAPAPGPPRMGPYFVRPSTPGGGPGTGCAHPEQPRQAPQPQQPAAPPRARRSPQLLRASPAAPGRRSEPRVAAAPMARLAAPPLPAPAETRFSGAGAAQAPFHPADGEWPPAPQQHPQQQQHPQPPPPPPPPEPPQLSKAERMRQAREAMMRATTSSSTPWADLADIKLGPAAKMEQQQHHQEEGGVQQGQQQDGAVASIAPDVAAGIAPAAEGGALFDAASGTGRPPAAILGAQDVPVAGRAHSGSGAAAEEYGPSPTREQLQPQQMQPPQPPLQPQPPQPSPQPLRPLSPARLPWAPTSARGPGRVASWRTEGVAQAATLPSDPQTAAFRVAPPASPATPGGPHANPATRAPRPLPGPPRRRGRQLSASAAAAAPASAAVVAAAPAAASAAAAAAPARGWGVPAGDAAARAAAAAEAAVRSGPRWGVEVRAVVKNVTMESPTTGFKILRAKLLEAAVESPDAAAHRLASPASPAQRGAGATIVLLGGLPSGVVVGSTLVARGTWEHNEKYGWQIRVCEAEEVPPEGGDAIAAYLAGCLRGVGPKTADTLVSGLGPERVMEVLGLPADEAVAALRSIKGIGRSKAAQIKEAWDNSEDTRGSMVFLQGLGLPPALAHRVATGHGGETQEAMRSDPYEAMYGLVGYNWKVAEAAAEKLDHDPGSPSRGGAALLHVLRQAATTEGHTQMTWNMLMELTLRLLSSTPRPWPSGGEGLRAAARLQRQLGRLVVECRSLAAAPEFDDSGEHADGDWRDDAICMASALWQAEVDVVALLVALAKRRWQEERGKGGSRAAGAVAKRAAREEDVSQWLDRMEAELAEEMGHTVRFSSGQRVAITTAVMSPISILTGGPGCGKTFATRAVVQYWVGMGKKVAMCAPTGRAAQRLQEIVGMPDQEAFTIHRLLGFKGRYDKGAAVPGGGEDAASLLGGDGDVSSSAGGGEEGGVDIDEELGLGAACMFGKQRPLPFDCVLLDEASMMDLPLAAALFNAVDPSRTQLVLVGDPDQLPPVGPGSPLRAAINCLMLPRVDLRQVFRQSAHSAIVRAAHAINRGHRPDLDTWQLGRDGSGLAERMAALTTNAVAAAAAPSRPPGKLPALWSDALLLQLPDEAVPADLEGVVSRVVGEMLPALGYDITRDVQVLSPTKRGPGGVPALNQRLQPLVNPAAPGTKDEMPLSAFAATNATVAAAAAAAGLPPPAWRVGDRVVQTRNDYDRGCWNGDLGYVTEVDRNSRQITVRFPAVPGGAAPSPTASGSYSSGSYSSGGYNSGGYSSGGRRFRGRAGSMSSFEDPEVGADSPVISSRAGDPDGRYVVYSSREVAEQLQLAWATTVHKSQGGEYPVVVLPLHRAMGAALLTRMLLYTAITRAKALLLVIGSSQVLAAAAAQDHAGRRLTGLAARLQRAGEREGLLGCEPRVFRDDNGDAAGGTGGAGGGGAAQGPGALAEGSVMEGVADEELQGTGPWRGRRR